MSTWAVLRATLIADLRERTRRRSFLVTLCLVIYLGYAVGAGQVLIHLGAYRGVYNAAWVGSLMSLVITFFLGLFGFYLVKNGIARDAQSGVGQIIATTPLTRAQYLLGKWLSNLALLSLLVAILACAALLIQLLRREYAQLQLWPLLSPFLLIALPAMALVAALAVLFETVAWLRGGFGNLVYLGLFCAILIAAVETQSPWLDLLGINLVGASMRAAVSAAFPDYPGGFVLTMASQRSLETFIWDGISWTPAMVLQRLLWPALGLGLVLIGARGFDRFDMAAERRSGLHRARGAARTAPPTPAPAACAPATRLTPLGAGRRFRANALRLVWLELLLLLKGAPWYWSAGMVGIWIGGVVAPTAGARTLWLLLTAIWPVLLWAQLGARAAYQRTEALLAQAPRSILRLLGAAWAAGVLLTGAMLSGVVLGRLFWGEPLALGAWALAALFIPALALALGSWGRSSKLFEVIYPILWYLGPMDPQSRLVALDYLGVHAGAAVNRAPLWVLAVIVALLLAAGAGRKLAAQP